MKGYPCAWENEECKCSGNVNFGIVDWNDYAFGKWSEMRYVNHSVDCVERNFKGYNQTGYDDIRRKCFCYPSSKLIFFSMIAELIRKKNKPKIMIHYNRNTKSIISR